MGRHIILGWFLLLLCASVSPAWAQEYFVETAIDNPIPFVGQQMTYTLRFYGPLTLSDPLPLVELPDFEDFWRIDRLPVNPYVEEINGRQYSVYPINVALYPTRIGDITIAPARVIMSETVYRSAQEIQSRSVTVQVQPLPDGAPADFSGGVGQFELSAMLDRQSAGQGEPLALRLTVTGTGNVEQLPPPAIPLPDDWNVFPEPTAFSAEEINGQIVGQKTFELLIVPPAAGQQTLPAITLAYFDPASRAYRALSTQPITLDILPSEDAQQTPVNGFQQDNASKPVPLKPLSAVAQTAVLYPHGLFWLVWLLPPAAAVGAWAWIDYQRRQQRDRARLRSSLALARAQKRLESARSAPPDQAYRQISTAILGYMADRLDQPPAALTPSTLAASMEKYGVNQQLYRAVLACWEAAEEGRFAPENNLDSQRLIAQTVEMLARFDSTWKSS